MQIGCGVIYRDKKLLLVKKAKGEYKDKWEFPGGKRETNETTQKCIEREVMEEINCKCVVGELIYYYKIREKNMDLYFHNVYLLNLDIKLSEEHTEYKWVSIEEAKKMDLIKWDYTLLEYLEYYFNLSP